jgi:hypothetical protein
VQPQTPSLQETDSRTMPGTPGALGGGPDQPPGGPGGTSDDQRKKKKKKKKHQKKKKMPNNRAPEPRRKLTGEGRRQEKDLRQLELNSIHDSRTGAGARPRQRHHHAGRGTGRHRGRIKLWGCDSRTHREIQGPPGPLGVVLTSPPAVLGGPVKTGSGLPVLGEVKDSDVSITSVLDLVYVLVLCDTTSSPLQ